MFELLNSLFQDNRRVLLLGFGKEGRSSYKYIRKFFPELIISIADANESIYDEEILIADKKVEILTGPNYLNSISNYDIIIKSPGVKIHNIDIAFNGKITSQTDLFLQCYADRVIGVTGTKGKSTTASLIKHFLDAGNKDSLLLGNIGVPSFDMIGQIRSETIIVYELSAHQLEYIHKSPHISLLLNIFPEHLDYFGSVENYKLAKHNIYKYQDIDDILITHSSLIETISDIVQEQVVVISNQRKFSIPSSPLLGSHNYTNIEFALLAVSLVGVDVNVAISSLAQFKQLPHRLEKVGEFEGVTFVNDSISTVPQSTIAALRAINNVDILILGGYDRSLDYSELVDFVNMSDLQVCIFLGKAGDRIYSLLNKNSKKQLFKAESLAKVFQIIEEVAQEDSVCLLSPAAASYDQFNNFEHRGDMFKSLAKRYKSAN